MKGKKTKKNQSTSVKGEAIPLILSWGAVDLILDITWTMEELIDLELEWDNLNTLEDIRFLKEKKDLWSKFELSTTNPTLLTLLFLNKTSKKKSYIDYIPFGLPKFEGDDEYFLEIIKTVTENNYLNINENALDENGRFSVTIKMHYEDKCKKIVVGTPKEGETEEGEVHEEEEEKVSNKDNENAQNEDNAGNNGEEQKDEAKPQENEEQVNNADNEGTNQQEGEEEKKEEQQNEETNAENKKEEKKKSKEKREPPKETTPGIPTKEEKLKKKKEEEKKKKEEEEKKKKEEEEGGNAEENKQDENAEQKGEDNDENKPKKNENLPEFTNEDTVLSKLNPSCKTNNILFINYRDLDEMPGSFQMLDLIELLVYYKTHSTNSPLIVVSFPEITGKDEESMCYLNSLFYLTDVYFFDFKDATKTFDAHYKTFTLDDPPKEIDKRKTYDYFIKGIASGTKPTVEGHKLGVFIDDFLKFTAIEAKGKSASTVTNDCRPYPKVNPHNINLIDEYKKVITDNKEFLMAIFLGGYLAGLAGPCANDKNGAFGPEAQYVAYVTGLEPIKRIVEILKNGLPLPASNDFYMVKISKAKLEEEFKKASLGNMEGGFILDCTNAKKSAMKDYVALYDYHLRGFFSSQIIRKDLKDKGFINTKGFIMYDPVYRSVMGSSCKNLKPPSNKEEMDKKLYSSIKGLDVANNIKVKEVDSKTMVLRSNSPTSKKIPVMKENTYGKLSVKKQQPKKKKKEDGEKEEVDKDSKDNEAVGEKEEEQQ